MNSEVLTVKILFFLFVIKLCCSAPIREIPHFVRNDNVIGYYEGKAWRPYRICKAWKNSWTPRLSLLHTAIALSFRTKRSEVRNLSIKVLLSNQTSFYSDFGCSLQHSIFLVQYSLFKKELQPEQLPLRYIFKSLEVCIFPFDAAKQ